jgi:hypothetical protein
VPGAAYRQQFAHVSDTGVWNVEVNLDHSQSTVFAGELVRLERVGPRSSRQGPVVRNGAISEE